MVLVVWGFFNFKKGTVSHRDYTILEPPAQPISHLPYHFQEYRGVSQAGCCERSLSQTGSKLAGRHAARGYKTIPSSLTQFQVHGTF